MDRLAESHLIENLVAKGHWHVEVSSSRIDYLCLICGGKVGAQVEVIAPYHADPFPTLYKRYLSERRQFCSDLVADNNGRCVSTQSIGMRGKALLGFQSETQNNSGREIDIVFFYHDPFWPGPELIRTTIYVDKGSSLPAGSVEMFMNHMAKLTLFWLCPLHVNWKLKTT